MEFRAPHYWEDIDLRVRNGHFLAPFAAFWGAYSKEYLFIKRASEIAREVHAKDVRAGNGEPYVHHPERAALMLLERLGIPGPGVTAAALLHDAYEDHPLACPLARIEAELNRYTRLLVEALSKPMTTGVEDHPNVRSRLKMAKVRAAGDVAVIVKGYERNDNILTLYGDHAKQERQMRETETYLLPLTKIEPLLHSDLCHSIQLRRQFLSQSS